MVRALIYVHFDPRRIIDPYVIEALRQYRSLMDTIVFVSTSQLSLPPAIKSLGLIDHFVARENIGRDFCSYKAGLQALGNVDRFDELVFANDSMYGPFTDPQSLFDAPALDDADLWGACVSKTFLRHVQGWFFVMRRKLIQSPVFQIYWDSIGPLDSRDDIVWRHEIGMSLLITMAGFQIRGLFESEAQGPPSWSERIRNMRWTSPRRSLNCWRRTSPRRAPYNPSELFWDRLWDCGVPFLKSSIIRRDYYQLDHALILEQVDQRFPGWGQLVRGHLRGLMEID